MKSRKYAHAGITDVRTVIFQGSNFTTGSLMETNFNFKLFVFTQTVISVK